MFIFVVLWAYDVECVYPFNVFIKKMCEKLRIFFRIQEGYTIKRKEREFEHRRCLNNFVLLFAAWLTAEKASEHEDLRPLYVDARCRKCKKTVTKTASKNASIREKNSDKTAFFTLTWCCFSIFSKSKHSFYVVKAALLHAESYTFILW